MIKKIFDKVLEDFEVSVGGHHSSSMFSSDEVIGILKRCLDNTIKFILKKEKEKQND